MTGRDTANEDKYASGMVHQPEDDGTSNYDEYQFSLFKRYLGGHVLEVGAGRGRITDLVIRKGHFDKFVISEPSRHFISRLAQRFGAAPKTRLIQGELGDVARAEGRAFDAIFSVHVMEHIEDDATFVKQQLELLRPGGRLIILVPALQFLYSQLDRNIGHFRRYNKSTLRSLFRHAPARIEKLFYSNFVGVLGSLYFSKFKRIQFQSSERQRKRFFRIYQIFSQYFIPGVQIVEKLIPVPIGLNLTLIAEKRDVADGNKD